MWRSASLASPFLNTPTPSSDSLCSLRFLSLSSGSPPLSFSLPWFCLFSLLCESLCLSLSPFLSLSMSLSLYLTLLISLCLSVSASVSLSSNFISMRRRTLFFSAPVFQRGVGSLVLDLGHPRLQAPVLLVLRTGKPPLPS